MQGILEYTPGNTILHQANPIAKLGLSLCICISCFLSGSIPVLAALILLDLAIGYVAGVFSKALSLLKGLCKVCVFLFLLQLIVVREGQPLWLFVTDQGLLLAAKITLRLIGATIPLALVLAVTQMSDLSNALVSVLHMPYKYAFTLTTAVRFIPVFIGEMNGIMEAQTARGVEFDTKNIWKKIKLILPLCAPLLITSVRKADAGAMAVEIRGFHLRTRESAYKTYPCSAIDGGIAVFCMLLMTMAYMTH